MMTKKKQNLVAKWRSALTGNDAERFRHLEARFPDNFAETIFGCEVAFHGSGILLCKWLDEGMDSGANESGRTLILRALQECPRDFFEHLSGIMEDWTKIDNNKEIERGFAAAMRTTIDMKKHIAPVSLLAADWLFLFFYEKWGENSEATKLPC